MRRGRARAEAVIGASDWGREALSGEPLEMRIWITGTEPGLHLLDEALPTIDGSTYSDFRVDAVSGICDRDSNGTEELVVSKYVLTWPFSDAVSGAVAIINDATADKTPWSSLALDERRELQRLPVDQHGPAERAHEWKRGAMRERQIGRARRRMAASHDS